MTKKLDEAQGIYVTKSHQQFAYDSADLSGKKA